MNVLGLSALYHDAAACMVQDGVLVSALEEEKLSRRKHDPDFPGRAARACLDLAGLDITDIDAVAWYEDPALKLDRQVWMCRQPGATARQQARLRRHADPELPERLVRQVLGYSGPVHTVTHHEAHAASAFLFSGNPEAALMTVDGVGEWATTSYGVGQDHDLVLFDTVPFPHSIGLVYSAFTSHLGFRANNGEYKVMGLAAYGRPRFVDLLHEVASSTPDGQVGVDARFFDFVTGGTPVRPALVDRLGIARRDPDAPLTPAHHDLAASVQQWLEEVLLDKVRWLHGQVPLPALCLAGGVALNCVANARIRAEGPFERLFVQPVAGDAGGALGAAALVSARLGGPRTIPLSTLRLGPVHSPSTIARLLDSGGVPAEDHRGHLDRLLDRVVDALAAGQVVGWFQGRAELGPRALGGRSILADPRDPAMKDRVNALVKEREGFRPFAPVALETEAARWFEVDGPRPWMIETCRVRPGADLPAVTHVDGTARLQTVTPAQAPRLSALLERFFGRTGCPVLLNTSFNVRGEPIVCAPVDALVCLARTNIDLLVLGDFIIERRALPETWLAAGRRLPLGDSPVDEVVYAAI